MPPSENTHEITLEMVHFQTDSAISEAAFVALFAQTESLVQCQPGFLSRQLIRADDGRWTDLVLWRSRPEAEAAAAIVTRDPAFAGFASAIRMETVEIGHHRLLAKMGG